MASAQDVIDTLALVFAAGLVSEVVAGFLRIPRIVVLLAAGAVLGPDVADLLDLPLDSVAVQILLTLGVSMILFYGGLGLSFAVLRPVVAGLGLLAIPGVLITAFVTGAVATVAFDVPFEVGLLIGVVLALLPTRDPIPLFEHMRIRPKVGQARSSRSPALNDVTGAVLALALASFVIEGEGIARLPAQRVPRRSRPLDGAGSCSGRRTRGGDLHAEARDLARVADHRRAPRRRGRLLRHRLRRRRQRLPGRL